MTRTTACLACSLLLLASACGGEGERPPPEQVDCTVADGYEFLNISNFNGMDPQWFSYADPTPGGVPDQKITFDEDGKPMGPSSEVPIVPLDPPGRCGEMQALQLKAEGHNFWGSGFADWGHNAAGSRANGTGFEGISFWARSGPNSEKSFLLNVDDPRTINLPADGYGPGDVAPGTACRLPPPSEIGEANCYNGGVDGPPSGVSRVPAINECGNAFHTWITTTETWQLFLIPWDRLVQWPCPNRLDGGIDRTQIAKFEIKFDQGTRYEILIDNIAFYRAR